MGKASVPVIAVDGPGGSGKGTVSQLVAHTLGWHFLDSGALYRLVALAAAQQAVSLEDEAALAELAGQLDIQFLFPVVKGLPLAGMNGHAPPELETKIMLDGQEVTKLLRGEDCASAASRVAVLPGLRAALLERQKAFRRPPGLVADGRDMGSVVFSDAELKIFLTASVQERALRRHKQLKAKGMHANLTSLIDEIAERDARDSARSVAPMKPAPGAIVIDTSSLSIGEVVQQVLMLWHEVALVR
ncbi:MAG TPA: (d)CMP kinase [Gammaproteobacteria bacterium]|nr:(d)CMP kinase [Gammaproteobacteria bacterium]